MRAQVLSSAIGEELHTVRTYVYVGMDMYDPAE